MGATVANESSIQRLEDTPFINLKAQTVNVLIEPEQNILIIDDQSSWRSSHQSSISREQITESEITFSHASNAEEAYNRIIELQDQGLDPFLMIDIHMDGTGSHPELNGDSLIAKLHGEGRLKRFVIISGTLSDKRKVELAEGVHGLPFISKDGLGASAAPHERDQAMRNLRRFMESEPIELTDESVSYIETIAKEGMHIDGIERLIDEIKGRANVILQTYGDELPEEISKLLKIDGLYRGNQSQNVHAYKNELAITLDRLHTDSSLSPDARLELDLFQGFINNGYISLLRGLDSCNVTRVAENLCDKLRDSSGRAIEFLASKPDCIIASDPIQFQRVLTDLLHNAIIHSTGKISVRCSEDNITIKNKVNEDFHLPFSVINNRTYGEDLIQSTSTSGSGTGIKSITNELQNEDLISLDLNNFDGEVRATLYFDQDIIPEQKEKETEGVSLEAEGDIVFLCHDKIPKSTFEVIHSDGKPINITYKSLSNSPFQFDQTDTNTMKRNRVFVQGSFDVFSHSFLCVIHMCEGGFSSIVQQLSKEFPQLVILPVGSNFPDWMNNDTSMIEVGNHIQIAPQVLTRDDVEQLYSDDDPAALHDTIEHLHTARPAPREWQTLMNIAFRKSRMLKNQ